MMNGQAVTEVSTRVNSLRCIDSVEDGVYFGASNNAHSNYLRVMLHTGSFFVTLYLFITLLPMFVDLRLNLQNQHKANNKRWNSIFQLLENFKVGDEISISMEVRPRNSTGLLLSVHGDKDYLVLEMLENEVAATVENGNGPFRATYKLANSNMLCDGTWHKIHGELSTGAGGVAAWWPSVGLIFKPSLYIFSYLSPTEADEDNNGYTSDKVLPTYLQAHL